MTLSRQPHWFLLAALFVGTALQGGCTHTVDRYSVLPKNQVALRDNSSQRVRVADLDRSAMEPTSLPCGAMRVTGPDGKGLMEYVRESLIDELQVAGVYSETSPISLSLVITKAELDASAFQTDAVINLGLSVRSSNSKKLSVDVQHRYTGFSLSETFCEVARRAFPNATQDLLGALFRHPEFGHLLR